MTIFARTNQGQEAAYKTESVLPRKLRSILKLIDGKTTLLMFEQNLRSFGDVRSIFYSLAEAGLIRVLPDSAQHVGSNLRLGEADRQPLMGLRDTGDWMLRRNAYAEHFQSGYAATSDMPAEQNFPLSDAQAFTVNRNKANALKAVVGDMADFVLTHMPDQSFGLLKEIEQITSIELLGVTLGGYEQLVSHFGPASEAHLKNVRQVVRENM